MTSANVRHHLSILLDEGAIQVAGKRQAHGPGRPSFLYMLTDQVRQHNLGVLASALLREQLESTDGEAQSRALKSIARRLGGGKAGPTNASLTQRLQRAVERLNQQHYDARWEAHAEAPQIILGHCPFAEILPDHPELCRIDSYQLEGLLGAPVRHKAKLARDSRGRTYCLFAVGKK
jgi:predicted ArsR family transcriptional regulator